MQIAGLSLQPPMTLSGFTGAPDTVRAMVRQVQGPRGEKSMLVRSVVERITAGLQPKDYLGEIIAVRNWVAENVRYLNDPLHVELVKDPQRLIEEVMAWGKASCDCDESAALMAAMCLALGRVVEFVIVGFGERGSYSHVFCRVLEPKSGKFVVLDTVAGTGERGMLQRVTTYKTWSLDEAA